MQPTRPKRSNCTFATVTVAPGTFFSLARAYRCCADRSVSGDCQLYSGAHHGVVGAGPIGEDVMRIKTCEIRSYGRMQCRTWRRYNVKPSYRRGAVVVEFAVAAPIFFLLVFASIEFGRLNMIRHAAENAAYEAARHAVVPGATSAEAIAKANQHLSALGFQGSSVTVNPTTLGDEHDEVTVAVNVPLGQNSWVFPRFTEGHTVSTSSTLRTERYRGIQ